MKKENKIIIEDGFWFGFEFTFGVFAAIALVGVIIKVMLFFNLI